jgi:NAD-dependent SIR2 family protein deacetylase
VHNVIQCHGSFASASCLACKTQVKGSVIEREILAGEVPLCANCSTSGLTRQPERTRRKKRKSKNNDDDDDDDADEPLYPPWVMKAG